MGQNMGNNAQMDHFTIHLLTETDKKYEQYKLSDETKKNILSLSKDINKLKELLINGTPEEQSACDDLAFFYPALFA